MAKLCTDIRQSKKLIELGLDISTSDMIYSADDKGNYTLNFLNSPITRKNYSIRNGYRVPAWSLPKLLELIPNGIQEFHPHKVWGLNMSLRYGSLQYVTDNFDDAKETKIFWDINKTEVIDAVFDMAVWLAENGYLWKNGEFRNTKELQS